MRRKAGALVPLELSVLDAGIAFRRLGVAEFHGFMIAKEIKERDSARLLTAYGTLYKALDRMEKAGLVTSRWEDPLAAAAENRPRRRLYQVSVAGETALADARALAAGQGRAAQPTGRGLKPERAAM